MISINILKFINILKTINNITYLFYLFKNYKIKVNLLLLINIKIFCYNRKKDCYRRLF